MCEPSHPAVTSSWYAKLPDNFARIGISRFGPRGQRGFRIYRALAPGPWFKTVGDEQFRHLYLRQLAALDPEQALRDITVLADGKTPALLCHERPPPDSRWCHRGLVSAWFSDTLGMAIAEYGHEADSTGWRHPKLPVAWQSSW